FRSGPGAGPGRAWVRDLDGPGSGTWAALGAAATVERRDHCAHPVVSALHRCFDSRAGSPSTAGHDHLGLSIVRISPEHGPQARTLIARIWRRSTHELAVSTSS